jgi:regulator of sigma E protease
VLPEIGEVGQAKLLASSVLVIGAGGLGSSAIAHLAASGIGRIGVGASKVETREVGILEAPWAAVLQTGNVLRQQMIGLGQIISGRRPLSELGGPLKIAKVSGEAMSLGILTFISLAALISINLGFINLLPIPMLDGGHLLLYGIEAIRRRPATPQVQEWAFRAGFVMLAAFMLMVTFNDLASFGLFESG